jgi:tetratricopeptide (TPR) repeat protein
MLCERHPGSAARPWLLVSFSLCFAIIAVLALPRPSLEAFQYGDSLVRIEGLVYAQRSRSVANARVRLESSEGDEVFETGVNDQGRYSFLDLRRAVYHLIATADGYETFRQTVDLTRSPTHAMVDIMMTPAGNEAAGGDPPSLTDAQAPPKASKEYQQGLKALAANKLPEAKAHFAKAVAVYPCYARAQTAASLGMISDHDLKGAETALKTAIGCDPGFTSASLKLGELYNAEVRFEDSRKILEDGLRREPGSWRFHYHLGVAYFGLGAYAKAEGEFLRSESLTSPPPPDVHVKLADLYSKEKHYDQAYQEMQAYLDADPNGRFAEKIKGVMEQMRSSAAVHPAPAAAAAPESASKP